MYRHERLVLADVDDHGLDLGLLVLVLLADFLTRGHTGKCRTRCDVGQHALRTGC